MRFVLRVAPSVLLFLFFAQVVMAGPQLSLTADEPVHMAQGYVYWTRGDFRFQPAVAQPPLPDLLAGAGLLLQPGPLPEAIPGWTDADLSCFARAFVKWYGPALEAATFVARFPVTAVALIGAALVYRWAYERFGRGGSLLALALFAFDPNLLAHAGLATTDVLVAIWGFVGVYTALRWSRGGHGLWGLASGVALGLALGSKTSGFFPLVIVGLLFATDALEASRAASGRWTRQAGRLALIVVVAAFTLWALYRFELRPLTGKGVPLPFVTHLLIWKSLQAHISEGHIAFLMGKISYTGWWYYYPLAFLLKTPLPTLITLVAAFVELARQSPRHWWRERDLWVCPLLYGLVSLSSTIDIGYRYLLVILPFLYVSVGWLVAKRNMRQEAGGRRQEAGGRKQEIRGTEYGTRNIRIACCVLRTGVLRIGVLRTGVLRIAYYVLLAWLAASSFLIFPHYLAYFNELAGGPGGGYRYLVDSNLDWGQSFKALRAYLDKQGIEEVYLGYYTYTDPALYGIRYRPIAPAPDAPPILPRRFDPEPGVYVIGATNLQGVMVVDQDIYDWFRHREPVARPGFALFVYRVEPREERPAWLAQCSSPVAPLTAGDAVEGLGRNDLRIVYFDCTSAWLYPGGGERPGWYALFRDTAHSNDPFIQSHLATAHLSYEQHRPGALPPFALYEQESAPALPSSAPGIRFDHLTFLGHTAAAIARTGETVEVGTWWRVESHPQRPLSIMMHLTGPGDAPVIVGDGLGVPLEQWQAGDIIVQRHRLAIPADALPGEYIPTTGVYWLDTMERWRVESAEGPLQDQLALPAIRVVAR